MAYLAALVVFLILMVTFFALNRSARAKVDAALSPLKVPERRLTYSADDLMRFREKALSAPGDPLELYLTRVLSIDIGFAVSLALASAILWQLAANIGAPARLVLAGTAMSYLYGLFDVGEDVTLKILLKKELIRSSDASVAAAFTLGKLLTISLSIFGVVIFLMLSILLWPGDRD